MTRSLFFTFGPDNSYFFYCQGTTIHENCSWAFRQTVLAKLGTPYFVSLGPGENDYCAFYETRDGKPWYSINYPAASHLRGMENFFSKDITANPDLLQTSHIALGPGNQFLGCTRKHLSNPSLIPANIKDTIFSRLAIEKTEPRKSGHLYTFNSARSVMPKQMSFGFHGEWFVRWTDGLCAWDLSPGSVASDKSLHNEPSYPGLRQLLGYETSEAAPDHLRRSIDYLVFDLWNARNWFCVLDSGHRVEFSLPTGIARKLQPVLDQYLDDTRTVSTVPPDHLSPVSPVSTYNELEGTNQSISVHAGGRVEQRRIRVVGASELAGDTPPMYQEEDSLAQVPDTKPGGFWKRLTQGLR